MYYQRIDKVKVSPINYPIPQTQRHIITIKSIAALVLISLILINGFAHAENSQPQMLSSKLQDIETIYTSDTQQALTLAKELHTQYPDNGKVNAWLGRLYPIFSEFELGYQFAKQALEMNIPAYDKTYMYLSIASYYKYKQSAFQQFEHLEQAIQYAKKTEDPELILEVLSIYSGELAVNNRIDQAMEYMSESYDLIDTVSSPETLSTMFNALCTIYIKTGHMDAAIEAMLKSIQYVTQTGNTQQLSVAYYNLADIYIKTKEYKQAISAYQQSEHYSRDSGDILGIAYAYMGMGRSYLQTKQYELALNVLLDAEQRFLPENHVGNLIQIYGDLANTQFNLQQYDEAQITLNKLNTLKPYQTENSQAVYLRAMETQANVLFAIKRFEQAYKVQKEYINQLRGYHKKQIEISNESAFENLKNSIYAKDNQLLVLENQLKKAELDKHKKQTNLLLVTAMFAICIAVFVTFILSRNIKLQTKLDKLATTDELTGLFNRRKIMNILSQRFNRFKKSKQPLYVCMFDLDLFKNINDKHGHVMGDTVLKSIADSAIKLFGPEQPIGRYGGEEFLIILNSESYQAAHSQLEIFRKAVEEITIDGLNDSVTISLGLSEASTNDAYQTDIIQRADKALYDAKKSGRNKLCGK